MREREGPAAGRAVVKALLVLAVTAAVVGPWMVLVERRLPGFLGYAIGHDVVNRVSSGLEGHSGPPGYYLLTIWGTLFPWSLFLPAALMSGWQHRHVPQVRYALAAVVGPWLMFEGVRTKLPHYLLPAFPPLAFLLADVFVRNLRRRGGGEFARPPMVGAVRAWVVAVGLLGLLPWAAVLYFPRTDVPAVATAVASLAAIAFGAVVYRYFARGEPGRGLVATGAGMFALVAVLFGLYLPRAAYLQTSRRVADVLKANGATGPGTVVMQDYKEPSLAFYQGGTIREEPAMTFRPADLPRWVVTTSNVFDAVPERDRAPFDELARVQGLAYAGGRRVTVVVLRKR